MLLEKSVRADISTVIAAKYADYSSLVKMRLSSLVVFTAAISYLYADKGVEIMDWSKFISLIIGGFLVTGSANGFNQVLERNLDKFMKRTQNRPLPSGRMSVVEALIASLLMGISGILILGYQVNYLTAFFGIFSLLSYAFIYTPLKQVSRLAVFVGAIPGAMPPLLGYVASANHFGMEPGLLFAVQFVWQFTHFWAIAWLLNEDYNKAGFYLLPSLSGTTKASAYWIMASSIIQIPVSVLLYSFHYVGVIYLISAIVMGVWGLYPAYKLVKNCDAVSAKKVMLTGFLYITVIQVMMLIDKI
ncbi:protoheme IX farnesyltransferase [Solitalea longa]|uniref:Protoheme IX farnesyltransferase n=1 Tax=Solitalea longa TaxID=2079460 RepID=A0A2S4ZZ81_9SPHI|nr:heme o synthase [Solitalea longa]POY35641.1 protoheme IX farnesyltransferase [Solitalea longa]